MTRYAQRTQVSPERTIAEIQRTLLRYQAQGFTYGHEGNRAFLGFKMADRVVRILMSLPDPKADEFWTSGPYRWRKRPAGAAQKAWEQACRQRWRALALAVKAKLESVESGIETFEQAFLAHLVIPGRNGQTVGDIVLPELTRALQSGELPKLLPG